MDDVISDGYTGVTESECIDADHSPSPNTGFDLDIPLNPARADLPVFQMPSTDRNEASLESLEAESLSVAGLELLIPVRYEKTPLDQHVTVMPPLINITLPNTRVTGGVEALRVIEGVPTRLGGDVDVVPAGHPIEHRDEGVEDDNGSKIIDRRDGGLSIRLTDGSVITRLHLSATGPTWCETKHAR